MRLIRSITSIVFVLVLFTHVHALENDKNKQSSPQQQVDPADRIEQLLESLRNERKEEIRVRTVEELEKLASSQFPEVVSGLIDVLVRDGSTSVRKAVIHSLAAIEPATHEVKDALEQAVKQDKSWTVRQAARIALWKYKPKDEPPAMSGPRLRNTSKSTNAGKVNPVKANPVKPVEPDPLKSLPIPMPPTPVLPVVPGPSQT